MTMWLKIASKLIIVLANFRNKQESSTQDKICLTLRSLTMENFNPWLNNLLLIPIYGLLRIPGLIIVSNG